MKEIWKLEKPQSVVDAAKAQKGLHIVLEILIAIVVFFVATIAEMIVIAPATFILLYTSSDYLSSVAIGDVHAIMEVTNQLVASNPYVLSMLFATGLMTLVTLLFCKLIQKRKMNSLGFRKKGLFKEYIVGLVIGFALFSGAVLICVLTGSLEFEGTSSTFVIGTFLLFVVGYMIQGMAEEVLCRGYMMVSIGRRYSMLVAIIVNSVFFAALHLGNSGISILAFVNLTLFGVFASVYYIKRDNIWGVCAIHSVWNLVQGNVYGIRVSGMETSCSVFSSQMIEGKDWINGGAFGLEGGIAVTVMLVVGTVILLCMKGKEAEIN